MHNVIFSIQSSHYTPFLHNSKNQPFSSYHPASFLLFHIFTFEKFPLALSSFLSISIPISLSLPQHKSSPLCTISSVDMSILLRILLLCSHSSLLCLPHLPPFPMPSSMTLLSCPLRSLLILTEASIFHPKNQQKKTRHMPSEGEIHQICFKCLH